MKKIIVACGNGVATSQSVAFKVNKMLKARHIQAVVEAVNLRSLERELHGAIAVSYTHLDVYKRQGLA